MASARRKEKMESLLSRLVSEFFLRMNFEKSVVSVTGTQSSENLRFAKIFISVYPEKESEKVLETVESKAGEIKKCIASKLKTRFLPELKFSLDMGEKNRRRIEELLKKNHGLVAKR